MEYVLIALVLLAGSFTQSLSGFGSALVAMPFLLTIVGPREAAPLMALASGTMQIALLIRYRRALRLGALWRLALAAFIGIPIGAYALTRLNENVVLGLLGVVLVAYAVYALTRPKMPELRHNAWAYAAGFVSGLLGGAYTTNGPPVIVYGSCRRWNREEFKANLQGFFSVCNVVILATHAVYGNLTAQVFKGYLAALPGLAVGVTAGLLLDRYINPKLFRKIMLALLVLLGLRLLVRATLGY